IEVVGLYLENLNIYRESLKHKEGVDKQLNALNHLLSNLKIHIYSKGLVDFDLNYTAYKGGNLGFREYLAYLVSKGKEKAIDIKRYENIYLLQKSLKEEDGIDFKRATIERDSLVDMLQKKLSRNALEELVLKTLEFKTGKLSQHDFYNYILGKAKLVNVDLGSFSELRKYIAYIAIHAAVDKTKIFEEVNHLEDAIKSSLYENDSQRELSRLSKNLALLKNIFNISLSKDDYRYYRANESSFDMRNYTRFISRYAGIYNITATLDDGIERIDQYREDISSFYECSLKRDRAFLGNIKFDEQGTRVKGQGSENRGAIIVTGGFHTENLCELFKKSGISYVSIMPNFRNKDGYECPYFRLLAGELTALQKRLYSVFSSANFSSIAIAPMLSRAIAEEVWGRLGVTVWDAEVIIRASVQEGRKVILSDAIDPETAKPLEFGSGQRGEERLTLAELAARIRETTGRPVAGSVALSGTTPQAPQVTAEWLFATDTSAVFEGDKDVVNAVLRDRKFVEDSIVNVYPEMAGRNIEKITLRSYLGQDKTIFEADLRFEGGEERKLLLIGKERRYGEGQRGAEKADILAKKYKAIIEKDPTHELTHRWGAAVDIEVASPDRPAANYHFFSVNFHEGVTCEDIANRFQGLVGFPGLSEKSLVEVDIDNIKKNTNYLVEKGFLSPEKRAEILKAKREGSAEKLEALTEELRQSLFELDIEAVRAQLIFSKKLGMVIGDPRRRNIIFNVDKEGNKTFTVIDYESIREGKPEGQISPEPISAYDIFGEKRMGGLTTGTSNRWVWTYLSDKSGFFQTVLDIYGDEGANMLRAYNSVSPDVSLKKFLEGMPEEETMLEALTDEEQKLLDDVEVMQKCAEDIDGLAKTMGDLDKTEAYIKYRESTQKQSFGSWLCHYVSNDVMYITNAIDKIRDGTISGEETLELLKRLKDFKAGVVTLIYVLRDLAERKGEAKFEDMKYKGTEDDPVPHNMALSYFGKKIYGKEDFEAKRALFRDGADRLSL
ncbi:MAG: hypothetical protein PHP46_06460, partial [Candidatus Omnitrophica bacterium]|nr:hypothetical protein [Candidatus Omnitrophota bacterium]